jgi:hypothetical protein
MSKATQMLDRLNLGAKFTLLLALVFLTGMGLSWIALSEALQSKAEREVVSKAQILLKTMNSRQYRGTPRAKSSSSSAVATNTRTSSTRRPRSTRPTRAIRPILSRAP